MRQPSSIIHRQAANASPSLRPWKADRRMRSSSRATEPGPAMPSSTPIGVLSGQLSEVVIERPPDENAVVSDVTARFFDAMAASYDELEPWYEHLYRRLHGILQSAVPGAGGGARALDAGCGTGFQTAIVAALGYRPHGLDVSAASLAVARARLPGARLVRGDLGALPYRDGAFDAVVCAGSAIDFVAEPRAALAEIGRVMRRGAWLLLEYERRFCLDLAWMVASGALGDPLGYGVGPAGARAALARPWGEGIWIDYPGYPRLRLFAD